MRSRISGSGLVVGVDADGALERLQRPRDAGGVVGLQLQQRLARRSPAPPRPAVQTTPAAADTGSSLRARPAPSRQAATPSEKASSRVSVPVAGAVTTCVSAGVGSGASGSPPWAAIIRRQTSIARPSASASAGSTSDRPAPASISRASARVSSTTSAGPPPASTSTDSATSTALPAARPSGRSIAVTRATVRTPAASPRPTIVRASSRASSASFMNAPEPVFTSSTSASAPSAIFLLMIELAISGIDSTVPVTSRSA